MEEIYLDFFFACKILNHMKFMWLIYSGMHKVIW